MSLEFEQLTPAIAEMAREAGRRQDQQDNELQKALQLLRDYAQEWKLVDSRMDKAINSADEK